MFVTKKVEIGVMDYHDTTTCSNCVRGNECCLNEENYLPIIRDRKKNSEAGLSIRDGVCNLVGPIYNDKNVPCSPSLYHCTGLLLVILVCCVFSKSL